MSDFDVVMLYGVVSAACFGFIAAAWYALNRIGRPKEPECDRLFFDCIKDPDGCGKSYPAASIWCDVCGAWAPDRTCSDCETWAEVQIIHYEGKLPSFDLAFREHKRLVDKAGW